MQIIDPAPPKCHRRRCWCTWWIVGDHQTHISDCVVCGVPKVRADESDYAEAGLQLRNRPVEEELDLTTPATKANNPCAPNLFADAPATDHPKAA